MFLKGIFSGGGYPFYVDESTGARNWPKFPVINEAITQRQPNYPLRLGTYIADDDGNLFQYVRAYGSALARGDAVIAAPNSIGTTITADATGDGKHVVKTNITAQTGVDSERGNFLFIQDAATAKQYIYRILGNTSGANSYITISKKDIRMGRGGYDGNSNKVSGTETVLANGIAAHIHRPYHVIPSSAVEQNVLGVAQGTVTDGNCTLVQVHGLGVVKFVGTSDPAVYNEVIVTSGTAGTAKGLTNAGTSALDAVSVFGWAPFLQGSAVLSPVYINTFGRW